MKILVETGCDKGPYEFTNMGDVAMVQACVAGLRAQWPSAEVLVISAEPDGLRRYCPDAVALSHYGRQIWLGDGVSLVFRNLLPEALAAAAGRLKRAARRWAPRLLVGAATRILRYGGRAEAASALESFVSTVREADLLVVCGAGGFSDTCPQWNAETLSLLEEATRLRRPVALLGQGLGPLTDPGTLGRAHAVFLQALMITLRGNRGATELARSLGLPEGSWWVTGDEALEAAYDARAENLGPGLGVNLRLGGPAATVVQDVEPVRAALDAFTARHKAPLVPLPIALHPFAQDDATIRRLLAGVDGNSDGGATLDSPQAVIRQVASCRAVVSGAYHAAVFALAQGLPVVGLARSPFFESKLLGLGDQFTAGVEVVRYDEPDVTLRLGAAIERAWQSAPALRPALLAASERQVDLCRRSYLELRERLGRRAHAAAAVRGS